MAGGLLQIAAYGYQDVYLTNNPQITFFKSLYRRYGNFSMQSYELTFTDKPDFDKFGKVRVFRLGDLCNNMWLMLVLNEVVPDANMAYVRRLGHAILGSIEVEIGGYIVDKHYGIWLDIWYELARKGKHDIGYAKMIGDVPVMTNYNTNTKPQYTLYIPLRFWFNRYTGLALPLIAIQYHDTYIRIKLEEKQKVIIASEKFTNYDAIQIIDASLLVNYIYLEKEERQKYAYVGHEYLIEQLQYTHEENVISSPLSVKLQFNHPTKEIIWVFRNGNYYSNKKFLCYTNKDDWTDTIIKCAKDLLLNSMLVLRGPIIDTSGQTITIIPGERPPNTGYWEEFIPNTQDQYSQNKQLIIHNESSTDSLWINTQSLIINNYSLINKINTTITLKQNITNTDKETFIIISDLTTSINQKDISIPIDLWTDTRINTDDIIVNQFGNYGMYITGKKNPVKYSMIEFNSQIRSEKKNAKFYGVLQPYMHHSNTPKDGINLYSFAIEPEILQPTGTANMSLVENQILTTWIEEDNNDDSPSIDLLNRNSMFYVFGTNYNIFRVLYGLTAVAYMN